MFNPNWHPQRLYFTMFRARQAAVTLLLCSFLFESAQALQGVAHGKYSEALINRGIGKVGLRYFTWSWAEIATKLFDDIKQSTDADEIKAKLTELEQLTSSYRTATEVRAMTGAKQTLEQLRYTYDEEHTQAVTKIEQSIVQRNGDFSFSAKGTFSNDFFQMYKRLQSLFQSAEDSANPEKLQSLTAEIEPLMQDYVAKLPAYEKLYADASVLALDRTALVDFARHFSRYKGELEKKKASLLADNRLRYGVEKAHLYELSIIKFAIAAGGESAATLVILQALSDAFGYQVNPDALEL